ncbi:HIT family protein [Ruania halotolerans]|uniref:HIT family protein n=1 Tax=Ruania halotolerans TaxID=2897773 RepID=UPI001E59DCA1|nr:HIT domain-containing protein [Ruania halotolerans]UFU04776.1 HIT domain-containing protein [Ruania halotolerans]
MEDIDSLAGTPDGYERLWTPHRMAYIAGESKPTDDRPGIGCPFCSSPDRPDADGLVVYRGTHCYVVLNLFPYNPGHLLICPYRHVPDLVTMSVEERGELIELTEAAMRTLSATKSPAGFNLGMNAGEVAGAGVAAHAHQHVVPRWAGDANFLPIIARTKALPELLEDTRRELSEHWGGSDGPG